MRISDWSSDVCSSDLTDGRAILDFASGQMCASLGHNHPAMVAAIQKSCREVIHLYSNMLAPAVIELGRALTALLPPSLQKAMFPSTGGESNEAALRLAKLKTGGFEVVGLTGSWRSEEHTSELQSLMRISYAVFCL